MTAKNGHKTKKKYYYYKFLYQTEHEIQEQRKKLLTLPKTK